MGKLVEPKVFIVGGTRLDWDGLIDYCNYTGCLDFMTEAYIAQSSHKLPDWEILISFYAKLCYRSLTADYNDNLTGVRRVRDNLKGTIREGHGSTFEHALINFVVSGASRVFECELIRHRAGSAFSIESGRYYRTKTGEFDMVIDPILAPVADALGKHHAATEQLYQECVEKLGVKSMNRDAKKKYTSALRRILPEGKAKEIGFSLNIRTLRHVIMLRTSRHAEWEIRTVFGQVYQLIKAKSPTMFFDAREEVVDGLVEVSGMKIQPWETFNEPVSTEAPV